MPQRSIPDVGTSCSLSVSFWFITPERKIFFYAFVSEIENTEMNRGWCAKTGRILKLSLTGFGLISYYSFVYSCKTKSNHRGHQYYTKA